MIMALTEQQIEMLGDDLVPIFQQLEYSVICDIARRVAKTGRLTETAEIMVDTLRDKGYSPIAIQTQVMRVLGANAGFQREIESNTIAYKRGVAADIEATRTLLDEQGPDTWEQAGNMAFNADLSAWQGERKPIKDSAFDALVSTMSKRMCGELRSLTKSMGFRLPTGDYVRLAEAYTRMTNLALVKVASGSYSYQQAIEDCVRDLARSGLRTIDFASGKSYQLDTAVRNAVMTASSQLAGEITMHNMDQTGAGYVEVSAHWGARTGEGHANHAGWQGKVYKVEGTDGVYPNLESETGYPSDPKGLCGYNCQHTFYPFWPGISEPNKWPAEPEPKEWNGRTYDYYSATQEQRRREREIRALKRERDACEAAGLTSKAKQLGGLISTKTAEYEEFSDAMEISPKKNRLRVEQRLDRRKFGSNAKEHNVSQQSKEQNNPNVLPVGKIDLRVYRVISDDIATDDVIITRKQIEHVFDGHPEKKHEKVIERLGSAVWDPDYILRDEDPQTAIVLKKYEEQGEQYRIILKLAKAGDLKHPKNSIITAFYISEKKWKKYIRNKHVVYSRPEL